MDPKPAFDPVYLEDPESWQNFYAIAFQCFATRPNFHPQLIVQEAVTAADLALKEIVIRRQGVVQHIKQFMDDKDDPLTQALDQLTGFAGVKH